MRERGRAPRLVSEAGRRGRSGANRRAARRRQLRRRRIAAAAGLGALAAAITAVILIGVGAGASAPAEHLGDRSSAQARRREAAAVGRAGARPLAGQSAVGEWSPPPAMQLGP